MVTDLTIRLFKTFSLTYQGRTFAEFSMPRLQSLLAYLVLHRFSPISRQQLAYLYWPATSDAQARTNLRRLLHALRSALPNADELIFTNTHQIQWNPNGHSYFDVEAFESCAGNTASIESLSEAVKIYSGKLLPDCYDEWIQPFRERLDDLFKQTLDSLILLNLEAQDERTAIRLCKQLLQHDPLQEATYRQLIHLYIDSHDPLAAAQVYQACTTTLRRELDLSPSPETVALYQEITRSTHPVSQEPLTGEETTDLIGRASEWKRLTHAWQTLRTGSPHFVLLSGEVGIGKTSLGEEFLRWAGRRKIRTASAYCYPTAAQLPYSPITAWLHSSPLPPLADAWLSEIARLAPDVLASHPQIAPPEPITESWQQLRFYEAIVRALHSSSSPVILFIDDLGDCDRDTLHWLDYWFHSQFSEKVLLIATISDCEEGGNKHLTGLFNTLRRTGQLTEIRLERLSRTETIRLAAKISQQDTPPAHNEHVFEESEGIPLFIVEMALAARQELGAGQPANPASIFPSEPLDLSSFPPKILASIHRRLDHLSQKAQELTELASVFGRPFRIELLVRASQIEEKEIVSLLDELWQQRIIADLGRDGFDFSHRKIREVVYARIPAARRQFYHSRMAAALREANASNLQPVAPLLAIHYELSSQNSQAAQCYFEAAQAALQSFAVHEALEFLSRALRQNSEEDLGGRYQILLARERVYDLLGDRERQQADIAALYESARGLGRPDSLAESLIREASYAISTGDYTRAVTALQMVIQVTDPERARHILAPAQLLWGRTLLYRGEYAQAEERLRQALETAEQAGLLSIKGECLRNLGVVYYSLGDLARSVTCQKEALAAFVSTGDYHGEAHTLNTLGILYWYRRSVEDALRCYEQALKLYRENHDQRGESSLLNNLAVAYSDLGDLETASIYFHQSLQIKDRIGDRRGLGSVYEGMALMQHTAGNDPAAIELAHKGIEIARELGDRRTEGYALINLGHALFSLGDFAAAHAVYCQSLDLRQEVNETNLAIESKAGVARTLFVGGQIEAARAMVEEILHFIQDGSLDGMEEPFEVYLVCIQILQTCGDARAAGLIRAAQTLVSRIAAGISDPKLRRLFERRHERLMMLKAEASTPFVSPGI